MKTSLPADAALYHAQAKVFQRSKGRSSVAAAAYRSGTKLTDRRTGEVFDYTNKGHVISSFILAPTNAPAWAFDREELFNRVEASERKSNAVVAREWEISIPRDIPVNEWENFVREAVRPWVDAGAVADIAIHAPLDQYGGVNVHVHVMLTTRELDASTETGFSKRKNETLRKLHESGGKDGAEGRFADALKAERERLANVMNTYLERANSPRRVSHLTNAARYAGSPHIPEPEPTMGESRIHTAKTRKKSDRIIDDVAQHRSARALQNALTTVEEEIMSEFPRMQSDAENGIRPKHQQNFKASLVQSRLPGVNVNSDDIYMVDPKDPRRTCVQMRDGGWLEVDHAARQATVYGPNGQADALAQAVIAAGHAEGVDRLPEQAAITRRGQKPRQRQQATPSGDIPISYKLPETAIESIADKWRSRGYTNVVEAPDGVYIALGQARLQDLGTEVRIHGKASDPAINALLAKAADEWGGELEAYGSQEFKDKLWLEAQRQGIKVFDQSGKPYEPSPEIRAQFEADKARLDAQALDLEGVRQRKKIGHLMLEAANGSKEALQDLREADGYLWLLVTNFDEEQLAAFKAETVESIEQQLDGFRQIGREIEQEEKSEASTPAPVPAPDDEPEPEKAKAPQPA